MDNLRFRYALFFAAPKVRMSMMHFADMSLEHELTLEHFPAGGTLESLGLGMDSVHVGLEVMIALKGLPADLAGDGPQVVPVDVFVQQLPGRERLLTKAAALLSC